MLGGKLRPGLAGETRNRRGSAVAVHGGDKPPFSCAPVGVVAVDGVGVLPVLLACG